MDFSKYWAITQVWHHLITVGLSRAKVLRRIGYISDSVDSLCAQCDCSVIYHGVSCFNLQQFEGIPPSKYLTWIVRVTQTHNLHHIPEIFLCCCNACTAHTRSLSCCIGRMFARFTHSLTSLYFFLFAGSSSTEGCCPDGSRSDCCPLPAGGGA